MNKIIVLGGGSAGWMTAATLVRAFPNKDITVIESPNTPTVGVGESTIGGIKYWAKYLGIDDKDFLSSTDGIYKLSIGFTNWNGDGTTFQYPFGQPFTHNCYDGTNDWWIKKGLHPDTPTSDYAESFYGALALVNQNKLDYNRDKNYPFDFEKDTAYHFDAAKFGVWLRDNYCKPRGVKHISEDITDIQSDKNGIVSLNNYTADLFIDCTGFKALLLDKTLKEPFETVEDILPNNKAWATRVPYTDKDTEMVTYTNCTALNNGWVWNIPLWSRIGTGYVYSNKYISDEEALEEFKQHLGRDDLEFKNITMRVGVHERLWVKNVVGIGLAAGFIEPLESNGLFSVHEFLYELIHTLSRGKINQYDKDNFTYQCKRKFYGFLEFVAQHYAMCPRDDTPYWKENFNRSYTDELKNVSRNWEDSQFVNTAEQKNNGWFNGNAGFHCIAAGMNFAPITADCMRWSSFEKDWGHFPNVVEYLTNRKAGWLEMTKNCKSTYQFMKDNIYTEE